MQLEQSDLLSTDELSLDQAAALNLPVFSVSSENNTQSIPPQDKLISAWDGPALFSSLATFGIFISLAFLSQPEFDNSPPKTTLSVSLNAPQANSEPIIVEPEKTLPDVKPEVKPEVIPKNEAITEPQTENAKEAQQTESPPTAVTKAIDYSLIQSIIDSEPADNNPLGAETQKNTGPHNTVFDNKFRQYLHSEELKAFNRRRESVDIGNYRNSEGEHFSDGNGNCFKIIDNQGETMWVRKTCLKKQKRETEFGRLKLN
ncbi:hypothetical protein [Pseudoteredinibacter isoporae]|uniref:Uncharacterized protein n=1 Tax=Pseudoteredinibacter isoporae TaxID=570281 RepID=A0A7X0JW51_9GAMM|nr:hypothetical protein [Pseudoteredinibacter isoporae]MBB6523347.1 hypothetical protein [Pseudoteredinibacter isoporae]NHO88860.1 hypothetical protein [Pseudoteredinibacter isoporae]NIB24432.1 hypothetical protein [Pseudoteredinibacter isoporae]